MKLLVIAIFETVQFKFKLNAYHVKKPLSQKICIKHVKELIFPHSLSSFMASNNEYIPLINHTRIEFY